MELIHVIADIIVSLGAFFLLVGSIGLIRLPDFYSRAHAQGKADTLGVMLIIFGLLLTQLSGGAYINSVKLLIIIAFVGLTNPTGTNALVGAAFRFRLKPWFKDEQCGKAEDCDNENKEEEKD
jgi:multicomponent Na+:H+ antiporter subunit G